MARARPQSGRSRRSETEESFPTEGSVTITGNHNPWQRFAEVHRGHPALEHDAIYALPRDLITAIREEPGLQEFFSDEDLAFEYDLAETRGGFFLRRSFSSQPWSNQLFSRVGEYDRAYNRQINEATHRAPSPPVGRRGRTRLRRESQLDQAIHRVEAEERWGYAGWLVTDPTFRAERNAFRRKWMTWVRMLGGLPPRMPARDGQRRPVHKRYRALYAAYIAFLNRWSLEGMQTWDIVVPLRSFRAGLGRPIDSDLVGAGYMFHVPAHQLRQQPERLQLLAQHMLEQGVPEHLQGWLTQRDKRFGPDQYARLFNVYLCLELALRSRYRDRLNRNLERMDNAIGRYLSDDPANRNMYLAGVESIKKARLKMDRRLRP